MAVGGDQRVPHRLVHLHFRERREVLRADRAVVTTVDLSSELTVAVSPTDPTDGSPSFDVSTPVAGQYADQLRATGCSGWLRRDALDVAKVARHAAVLSSL